MLVERKARGWMRNKKEKALNPDLWERLLALCEGHEVTFVWLKGHAGILGNERCDQLSVQALRRKNLPADEGYENRTGGEEALKITQEGQPCHKCGTPVVKRKPRKRPKPGQKYAYEYYLICPECGTIYTVESAKKPVRQEPRLF